MQALDYSDNLRQPNWASWNLTANDTGTSGRSPDFLVDINLRTNFYWVQTTDYVGSGYDRGHIALDAREQIVAGRLGGTAAADLVEHLARIGHLDHARLGKGAAQEILDEALDSLAIPHAVHKNT